MISSANRCFEKYLKVNYNNNSKEVSLYIFHIKLIKKMFNIKMISAYSLNLIKIILLNLLIINNTLAKITLDDNDNNDSSNLELICPKIMHHVFEQSAPIGDNKSGNFTEFIKNSDNLIACVESCCKLKNNCNVAFIFNNNCYHVKCVNNELCLPKKRPQINEKLQMVLVNPVNDIIDNTLQETSLTWYDILKNSNINDYLSFTTTTTTNTNTKIEKDNSNSLSSPTFWKNFKKYHFNEPIILPQNIQDSYNNDNDNDEKRLNQFLIGNNLGYNRFIGGNNNNNNEQQYITSDDDDNIILNESNSCEIDIINNCGINEECIQIIPKTRRGICNCLKGYKRNKNHNCIKQLDLDFDENKIVEKILMSNDEPIINNNNNNDNGNGNDNVNSNDVIEIEKRPLKQLTIRVVSKTVQLPEKEVSLAAYTVPDESTSGDNYKYLWTLISQPNGAINGTISDQTKDKVKLTNLSEGLYIFKITVTGNSSYGETIANVTVLPEKRINRIPKVIITPKDQTLKLPSSQAILDGSTSIDDDKIIKWHWELIQGPIGYQPKLPETSTLQLTDLTPGNYTFKLTVTDSDNAQNSTTANITVLKGIDYPPEANAGSDVIVYLPHNNVTLNGSLSTDDREIVAWEWTKDASDQGKAVDMQNTRTPYLQLSNLEEGIYTFVLKVTDASNQSNSATVHVFVKPPTNSPPIANAGNNITLSLPQTWATLNGSQNDIKIKEFYWKQISGPNSAIILNANKSIANATSLTIGTYEFQLTVLDENKNKATDNVWIKIVQERNSPPIANGGGDRSITLPVSAIYLNGSKSSDDLGIVNWTWTRDGSSLAAGKIIGNTDHEPVLILTNVVPGRYVFTLTVTDDQGLSSSDTVSVIVHSDPLSLNLIELEFSKISVLSKSELDSLIQKIALLIGDVKIRLRELKIERKSEGAVLVFYVEKITSDGRNHIIPGLEIEKILKDKFWRDSSILGTTITDIRTTICQNNCSDHGLCNTVTRSCMCETFWMPSVFYFWGIEEANCDWSILYVIIGIFSGFLILSGIFWGLFCLCRQQPINTKTRTRSKVQKYALLGTHDDLPSFARNTSLSDSDTDSDVVFENRSSSSSKQNGNATHLPRLNGVSSTKYPASKGRRIKT